MKNRARAALAAAACLVALTGCVKVDADLEVNSNETISGSMQMGIDKQLAQAGQQSLDAIRRQIESGIKQTSAEGVECKAFEDDRFVGSSCELKEVPFNQMGSASGEGVSFRKEGDEFVVTVDAGTLTRLPQTGQRPEVDFKVTMPGKITSHDAGASVSGRTASYDTLEELSSISLRSESGGGFPLWLLALILVLLLAAVAAAIFFLRRGRKPGPEYPQGQYQQGQYPPGQVPPQGQGQWGPQYGAQPGEQPMQYGQPDPRMQYGQPNQPMQYGRPGPGQNPNQPMQYGHPGQNPGQAGQPMQYGPPGQYPGQPPHRPQDQPGQWGPPGQQPVQPGQPPHPSPGGWPQPPQQERPGPDPVPGTDDSGRAPRGSGGGGPEQS